MLKAISVENYRSFSARAEIELRPITILLGRNSSGKSSLTRLFPLLQQSIETPSSSPILWSADLVDLGNINDVKTHCSDGELRFGFKIEAESLYSFLTRYNYPGIPELQRHVTHLKPQFEYAIRLAQEGTRTLFRALEITIDDHNLTILLDDDSNISKLTVNGVPFPLDGQIYKVETKSIFPEIDKISSEVKISRLRRNEVFYSPTVNLLSSVVHGRTAKGKIEALAERLPYIPRHNSKEIVRSIPNVVLRKITDSVSNRISDMSLINHLPTLLAFINLSLGDILRSIAYIGPLRASGKRFDRVRELAVNRLDSSGENTAMYLYSLNDAELASFNDLLSRACGSTASVMESGPGHVSVQIGSTTSRSFENIADVGFGFSQLLPVVAQLHAVRERVTETSRFFQNRSIFAVEQPELHLHPALQGNLADLFALAFAQSADTAKAPIGVIETHSEALVSRFGTLIANGEISADDIAIYFVEKDEETGHSALRRSVFDPDGVINDWPIGFFSRQH